MYTTDVTITVEYPGVEYIPAAPESGGVYHEDREVALTSGSQMYRTYNAQFIKSAGKWKCVDHTLPAYATVQDPDGSIHFVWHTATSVQWTLSEWEGIGNNTVFNAVDFGLSTADTVGSNNLTALNAAILAAMNGSIGGTVFIPAGSYAINGTLSYTDGAANAHDCGIVIAGTGGGSELVEQASGAMFSFTNFNSGKGVRFRDLRLSYVPGLTAGPALSIDNSQNISCYCVYFEDCPQAVNYGNGALQCGLFDCTVDYSDAGIVDNATMIAVSGPENHIVNCLISQLSEASGGPSGCIGIEIGSASAPYVTSTQILDFSTGISIVGGGTNPLHAHLSDLLVQSWAQALKIQPNEGANAYEVFIENSTFVLSVGSSAPFAAGIYIDDNSGTVSDVLFSNCMCYNWPGAGLHINSGQNIEINGGRFGSCALLSPTSGAISITGDVTNVVIDGVDCTGQVFGGGSGQPYGISISSAVSGVYISNCDLSGNASGAISLSVPAGTALQIRNCIGYNDQGTPIAFTPTSTVPFSSASVGYFGPVVFYTSGTGTTISEIAINGNNTNLKSGTFTLSAGSANTATINYGSGTFNFLMIGQ